MEEDLRRLALLRLGGPAAFADGTKLPVMLAHSVAATGSVIVSFKGHRVLMDVSDSEPEFELLRNDEGGYEVKRHGSRFIRSVKVEPVISFSTENVRVLIEPDPEDARAVVFVNGIIDAGSMASIRSYNDIYRIAGIEVVADDVMAAASAVKALKEAFPDARIASRTEIRSPEDAKALADAGADSIEIDLVTSDDRYDPESRLELLKDASELIGKGRISARISIGLGESLADLDILMESLCRRGVVPELTVEDRTVKVHPDRLNTLYDLRETRMRRHGLSETSVSES